MLLETRSLCKYFGGVIALRDFEITVRRERGGIQSIIGPNGAGKTTFFNIITGLLPCTSGEVYFKGVKITGLKPHLITPLGITRTFQICRLVPDMTCLETVMFGMHCRTKPKLVQTFFHLPFVEQAEEKRIRIQGEELLGTVGLRDKRWVKAGALPLVQQRKLEIARALAASPQLLLLDEPSQGMDRVEMADLQELLIQVANKGVIILLIAHDMRLVMNMAQWITVLNFGEKIAEGIPYDVRNNARVVEAYLGQPE